MIKLTKSIGRKKITNIIEMGITLLKIGV